MKHASLSSILLALTLANFAAAEEFIVKDGKPNAEIVIARKRPQMVSLAALELQYHIQKMSGARLPIVTQTDDKFPVKIFVGESEGAKKHGVTADGLTFGAFKMVSGKDWMALVGDDFDFNPQEPWARSNNDRKRVAKEWAETSWASGLPPGGSVYKKWWHPRNFDEFMAARYGEDNKHVWNPNDAKWSRDYKDAESATGYFSHDGSGSMNAVCDFLRSLGVRWYMPGELGEVIPESKTIQLPADLDETVKADFPLRYWFAVTFSEFDDILWERRLGMASYRELLGDSVVHGLSRVLADKKLKEKFPECYSLYGGKRDTEHRGYGSGCYSSDKLVDAAVKYGRMLFDKFDAPHISLWPPDGYKQCDCEKCAGVPSNELVWGFVDKVAKELYKSHPDRLVSCGAYTPYIHPPKTIDKFSPNVVVFMANCGRPAFNDPEIWNPYWERLQGWKEKVAPGHLIRNENNRYSLSGPNSEGLTFAAIHPRAMAKDLKAVKGISLGDLNETARTKVKKGAPYTWRAPGVDHLTLYVNARFLWDADQDVEDVLNEYFSTFYGPVGDQVKKAFDYGEKKFGNPRKKRNLGDVVKFLEILHAARDKAGDTVYGKRVQAVIDEFKPLDELRKKKVEMDNAPDPRANAPVVVAQAPGDDKGEPHHLSDVVTGEKPEIDTTFNVTWDKNALVFDIRCQDPDMKNLFVTDDIWGGDSVAILLESPFHSYYQIEVNPEGKVFDADRKNRIESRWASMVEVKPEKGEDYWRVVVRVPVADPGVDGGVMDPFHYVVGEKPTKENPWFFNIGRVRQRHGAKKQCLTFSPVGKMAYHAPGKFAKLVTE